MKIIATTLAIVVASTTCAFAQQQCSPLIKTMTCLPTLIPPTIDANLSEWKDVTRMDTTMYQIGGFTTYPDGNPGFKCSYDDTKIYFAMEIPGDYSFDATNNHKCAAIGTMFKIGNDATFVDMGGCPDAADGCSAGIPASCDNYIVDIGAHWELRTTTRRVKYLLNVTGGTGDDLIANKDDEFGVSPYCRFDDKDGILGGNEWEGAWDHTNPIQGQPGKYIFELSRLLTTKSNRTDIQLAAGGTYKFGVAYWDPFELISGWSDSGHYLTGCASEWIDLILATKVPTQIPTKAPVTKVPTKIPTKAQVTKVPTKIPTKAQITKVPTRPLQT